MKRAWILIILIIAANIKGAAYAAVCPYDNTYKYKQENIINKITGIQYLSKKITELAIEKELSEELNSKVDAQLEVYNTAGLKNGEFKSLTLKGERLKYKALSISDFYAKTLCLYNKIIYKNKRIYYPEDIPFKYSAEITNEDIQNTIKSEEFQKELKRNKLSSNNINFIELKEPEIEIRDNKIYFKIPVKTLFGKISIKLNSEIEAENNKIVLKNISIDTRSNIIKDNIIIPITDAINPIEYNIETLNGKYCKTDIIKAEIQDNKIKIQGIFTIRKNIGGDK